MSAMLCIIGFGWRRENIFILYVYPRGRNQEKALMNLTETGHLARFHSEESITECYLSIQIWANQAEISSLILPILE